MASVMVPDPQASSLCVSKASTAHPEVLNAKTKKNPCLLPHIHATQAAGNLRTDAHSSSAMNDFLPLELLLCLKHQNQEAQGPPPGGTKLPQEKSIKTPRDGGLVASKPPANAWNHPNRRDRLKHLVEAPPCICGAGRDISFLCDTPCSNEKATTADKYLPYPTIIPEEYHVVKRPGVLALNIHDDDYVTLSDYHENHVTLFPSLKPSSRYEAVALRHTLDTMLQRAGIPTEVREEHLGGPTQMHKLLDLVQKEQTIYNIVFHELIRQVSVHCIERGELLADLRKRYASLLDRIPTQVKSLHNDLLAHRAVHRRLSQDLNKFRIKIKSLTDDLCLVRDRDQLVMEESRRAEDNLSAAIMSSEKNSELLHEYHGLYELQRNRLEQQVHSLRLELNLWQQAAYNLSRRVAEGYLLYGVQKLQLSEKSWSKLARHFVIVLRGKDTKQLSEVHDIIQEWQGSLKKFLGKVHKIESNMKEKLQKVSRGFSKWIDVYKDSISGSDDLEVPSQTTLNQLWGEVRNWQDIISCEAEQYAGDTLLARQEELNHLALLMEKWTSISLKLFGRHQKLSSSKETPLQSSMLVAAGIKKQSNRMECITRALDAKLISLKTRIRGDESGVPLGFVHLIIPLETWESKLSMVLSNSTEMAGLPESDWIRLGMLFQEWKDQIEDVIGCIGQIMSSHGASLIPFPVVKSASTSTYRTNSDSKTLAVSTSISTVSSVTTVSCISTDKTSGPSSTAGKEDKMETVKEEAEMEVREEEEVDNSESDEVAQGEGHVDVSAMTLRELSAELLTWHSNFCYAVDSQDTMMADQVTQLHSDLVHWTVQLLLVVTKTQVEEPMEEEGTERIRIDHDGLDSSTLYENYLLLVDTISFFTKRIHKCCKDVVQELVTERTQAGYPVPDEEARSLVHLGQEMEEWVHVADLLLHNVQLRDGDEVLSRQSTASMGLLAAEDGAVSVEGRGEGESEASVESQAVEVEMSQAVEVEVAAMVDPGLAKEEDYIIGVKGREEEEEVEKDKEGVPVPCQISVLMKDDCIHLKSIKKAVEEKGEPPPLSSSLELGLATEADMPQGSGSSKEEAEALLLALDHKNTSLKKQEEQLRQMKTLLLAKQKESKLAWSRVAALEKELKEAKEAKHQKKLSRTNSRLSSRKLPVAGKSTHK